MVSFLYDLIYLLSFLSFLGAVLSIIDNEVVYILGPSVLLEIMQLLHPPLVQLAPCDDLSSLKY